MKYSIETLLFLFISAIISLTPAVAQETTDTDKLHNYFSALHQNNRFMGSVAVMNGDDVVFEKAYGIISEDRVPATPESIYRVGSITKSYTATMILQLVDRNELTLETTLGTYFSSMPNADQITIEQMLRHQSGIVNFTNLPDYMEYFSEDRSRDDMLELFESAGTSFEPGENTEYSNTGYVLLGYVIEEVTGMRYADALLEMITQPLELTSTYFATGIDSDKNEADSFSFQQDEWQPASRTNMYIPHGAGAIVSTAEEVALFYHSLFQGELLSDESLQNMRSFEGPFGLGLLRFPFGDKTLIGHNGGIDGYQSNSAHYPEGDITFAILGNGINYTFNDILIGLLSITFGNDFEIPDFEEREAITLEENELGQYTGTFSSPNFPLNIDIFIGDGTLIAQATGQGAFPLTVYDETTMGFEPAGIEMQFSDFSDGNYRAFRLLQAGQQFNFILQEDTE